VGGKWTVPTDKQAIGAALAHASAQNQLPSHVSISV